MHSVGVCGMNSSTMEVSQEAKGWFKQHGKNAVVFENRQGQDIKQP